MKVIDRLSHGGINMFRWDPRDMANPAEIPGCGFYVETSFSANGRVQLCRDVLSLFGHTVGEFELEVVRRQA